MQACCRWQPRTAAAMQRQPNTVKNLTPAPLDLCQRLRLTCGIRKCSDATLIAVINIIIIIIILNPCKNKGKKKIEKLLLLLLLLLLMWEFGISIRDACLLTIKHLLNHVS